MIVAQPGTLTGSIGIFAGKVVIDGTLGKVGVTTETVKSGKNADIYSPFSRFSPEQRAKVGDYMQGFYKNFVTKVADGRHTTPERIDAVGQGRVWTGAQAKDRGLVDVARRPRHRGRDRQAARAHSGGRRSGAGGVFAAAQLLRSAHRAWPLVVVHFRAWGVLDGCAHSGRPSRRSPRR